jgi:hypothetical protein
MKVGLAAPLYLSFSWVLTVSYQVLTDTAVKTVGGQIGLFWPSAALWINSNIETITFIYAFTWIFVLSSVIPSALLGKERGILIQYFVVLILSLIAFFIPDLLFAAFGIEVEEIVASSVIFENVAVAVLYLCVPYLFMAGLDLRGRTMSSRKKIQEQLSSSNTLDNEARLNRLIADNVSSNSEEEK